MSACSTLCDPYLNLFRGIIPPLGGTIDLSPILAFIALDVSAARTPRAMSERHALLRQASRLLVSCACHAVLSGHATSLLLADLCTGHVPACSAS